MGNPVVDYVDCYQDLANAIILQAVKDYKKVLRRLARNPQNQDAQREKKGLERFFFSHWYLPSEKGVYFPEDADAVNISVGAERQRHYRAVVALKKNPCEETLWNCVVAFRGYEFKTMYGLPFTYQLKRGRGDAFTKELWIDRREGSKSLAWSSIMLAYHNIGTIGEVVAHPKALGDIRGVSYIYEMFYRFGLIDIPEKAKVKMKPMKDAKMKPMKNTRKNTGPEKHDDKHQLTRKAFQSSSFPSQPIYSSSASSSSDHSRCCPQQPQKS